MACGVLQTLDAQATWPDPELVDRPLPCQKLSFAPPTTTSIDSAIPARGALQAALAYAASRYSRGPHPAGVSRKSLPYGCRCHLVACHHHGSRQLAWGRWRTSHAGRTERLFLRIASRVRTDALQTARRHASMMARADACMPACLHACRPSRHRACSPSCHHASVKGHHDGEHALRLHTMNDRQHDGTPSPPLPCAMLPERRNIDC